tara:strand:- start:1183 stop:2169 length:987 start_codon:yes stop_codon:yes gene_type:complete
MFGSATQNKKPTSASVLLVSYRNFESTTLPCLNSLFNLSELDELQIIIVDNASGEETTNKIQHLIEDKENVEFIPNETNRGFPGGANDAAKRATSDIVFFLDIDTIIPNGAIRKLSDTINQNPDWIVGPVINQTGSEQKIFTESQEPMEILSEGKAWCQHANNSTLKVRQLDFCCIGMKRSTLEDIGPLEEGFGMGYYEDTDFCHRAHRKGYPLMMIEDVFIYHKGGGTSMNSKEQLKKSKQFFLKKHGAEGRESLLRQRDLNLRAINYYSDMLEYYPVQKDDILFKVKNRLQLADLLWPKNPIKKLLYANKIRAIKKTLRKQGLNLD